MGRGDDQEEARFDAAREAAELARHRFEGHDRYTSRHSVRVAEWALLMAGHVPGFSRSRLRRLEITALLHDYGKTFLDPEILRKGDVLTDQEWALLRLHPELGANHAPIDRAFVDLDGIRWHHKHFDGTGYPDGPMKGLDLPLEARLIAVADVFDALTSERAYRHQPPAYTPSQAIELMQEMAGHELDPALVALFAGVYGLESRRVGGPAGPATLQVQSVIGHEVSRARELLRVEIGPYDANDPLKGRKDEDRLVERLAGGLVRANLNLAAARNIARHVLKLPLQETFTLADLLEPPRRATAPDGAFIHHIEVILRLRRMPEEAAYLHVVAFMGQLWLSIGEHREDVFEVRLAR